MRYPPDLLDEIRARVPVSRAVERKVKLKRAGREYIGLSPFKTERTPSFTVNDRKGFYHCFASGEHGDIFTFLMKTEGLTFPEAVERLAAEAGVSLPAADAESAASALLEARLYAVLEEACRFYQASLSSHEGGTARAYLERRGVQPSEIEAFRLGYAPDGRSGLKMHLSQKGYTAAEMQDAGLLIHGEDIPVPYDRFRGRLIFPITDAKRRAIAFGGRALLPDQQPKYLNSPETALFHKGHILFNLAQAREASRAAQSVIAAEGYMDVIALCRAGFGHAVAPLGTALTDSQLGLLWSMAQTPTLCFDGDAAGRKAAHRALDGALPHLEPGRSLQFVFLPEGSDPDSMVRAGEKDVLANLLAKPVPLIDVLWSREESRHPLQTPEQRAGFEARLMALAARIAHKNLRYHYIAAFRERLRELAKMRPPANGTGYGRNGARPDKRVRGGAGRPGIFPDVGARTSSLLSSRIAQPSTPSSVAREALLIAAILRHPWLLDGYLEEIAALPLNDADCDRLRGGALAVHQAEEVLDKEKLLEHLSRLGYGAALERVERASGYHSDAQFPCDASKEQVLEAWRHVVMLHGKAGIPRPLQEAESDYMSEPTVENFSKLRAIVQQAEIVAS